MPRERWVDHGRLWRAPLGPRGAIAAVCRTVSWRLASFKLESFAKTQISKNALNKIKHLQGENRPKTTSCEGLNLTFTATATATSTSTSTSGSIRAIEFCEVAERAPGCRLRATATGPTKSEATIHHLVSTPGRQGGNAQGFRRQVNRHGDQHFGEPYAAARSQKASRLCAFAPLR